MRSLSSILCCVDISVFSWYLSFFPQKCHLINCRVLTKSLFIIVFLLHSKLYSLCSSVSTNSHSCKFHCYQLPTAEPVSTKSSDITVHVSQMETQHEPANLKMRLKTPLHQITFSAAQSTLLSFVQDCRNYVSCICC
jgi:hypothetical protein